MERVGIPGPGGLFPVPYSHGVFYFHWFNFYNAICFQIILGAPTVLLAKDLGANSTVLGIIAAFTPLMTTLQLPAARQLGKHSYRSFALMGWGLRSIFIATSAIVPLLSFCSREIRLGLLLASLFFFNVLRGVSSAAFLPWVTNIVGKSMRGRFIAIDQTFVYAGSLVTMLLSSLMMRGAGGALEVFSGTLAFRHRLCDKPPLSPIDSGYAASGRGDEILRTRHHS